MNEHLNTVFFFRGIVLQILRGAYESVRCMQVLLSNLSPSTMLWTGFVVWFSIVSTQKQANMGIGGMGGKCILLLLSIISKSKNLERNLLELGKPCHLHWWLDVEREAWKLAQISVHELTCSWRKEHRISSKSHFEEDPCPLFSSLAGISDSRKTPNSAECMGLVGDPSVEALGVTELRI